MICQFIDILKIEGTGQDQVKPVPNRFFLKINKIKRNRRSFLLKVLPEILIAG